MGGRKKAGKQKFVTVQAVLGPPGCQPDVVSRCTLQPAASFTGSMCVQVMGFGCGNDMLRLCGG
jgi:hypothetical protein